MKFHYLIGAVSALALIACSQADQAEVKETASEVVETVKTETSEMMKTSTLEPITTDTNYADAPAGEYDIEKGHAYIVFSYTHAGYSRPFLRWGDWDSTLTWDPENPENSSVSVDIKVDGIDSGVDVFNEHLVSADWFNAAEYPNITFNSTSVTKASDNTGTITGDLTIKGITKPVTLDVVFNKTAYDNRYKGQKMGFSARGELLRSDWDLGAYAPGVGDEIALMIETEYVMPDAPEAADE